ncbi:hypothetical protein OJF2_00640 [Aquisphaera giovannonii]|uniref:Uncharacterized protein n=1 Tax=Aquisphaera giovannonii TaxID=406548 RepID=A0A5B9VU50_9BACT|nr:hypothetical protein [Aquisphaera giovannonii]QEH31599.1 hypothetical protein OJF2_00640 [Aquisphaera giovannonii]
MSISRIVVMLGILSMLGGGRLLAAPRGAPGQGPPAPGGSSALRRDWLSRWERSILADARNRYCDRELGEEIGWLISPFEDGFLGGYEATRDTKWLDRLVDWGDAWTARGVAEPDGFLGWPKSEGASTDAVPGFTTDNMLGEAMGLTPLVKMARIVKQTPGLQPRFGAKAEAYLKLAERTFAKWDARGCWREVEGGGVWVVPPFGVDLAAGKFTEGYELRRTGGFTNPANKQNLTALWLIALFDATGKPVYRDRAEAWWRVMKSRIRVRDGGRHVAWNYWDPAGPWDYKADGSPRHWVGVHPNGGYYAVDVEGIVAAFEHGLVFARADIDRLIATNRDFMWDHAVKGAKFGRIDGGRPDPRWRDSPGVLWAALVPYDETLRSIFEANHDPASWGGLAATPWYLARMEGP